MQSVHFSAFSFPQAASFLSKGICQNRFQRTCSIILGSIFHFNPACFKLAGFDFTKVFLFPPVEPGGAYSFKKFFEVSAAAEFFQAVVIHGKAFFHILFYDSGRPDSELDSALRFYAVSDGDNHIKVIVLQNTFNPSDAFSCIDNEFGIVIHFQTPLSF